MRKLNLLISIILTLLLTSSLFARPEMDNGKVKFSIHLPEAKSVYLAGDFVNWDPSKIKMERQDHGIWTVSVDLKPGVHQYKFVIDGVWKHDETNPATTVNNYGENNSIFHLSADEKITLRGYEEGDGNEAGEKRPDPEGTLYLALIWHQHQPFYLNAEKDQLVGPWVRTHATKDYYDMTAMLKDHPDIHVTVNLTPVVLTQMQKYYVERLGKFYDKEKNRIRDKQFMAKYKGKTDPWIDLMFTHTSKFGLEEEVNLIHGVWNAFGMSKVQRDRFPQFAALHVKDPAKLTLQDKRNIKCWFFLAHFDPDFLRSPVKLVTSETINVNTLLEEREPDLFYAIKDFSEDDANFLVTETYKIMAATIPLHAEMGWNSDGTIGQIELITTPFYHPILPLLYNARAGRSEIDAAPEGLDFAQPNEARWQVKQAVDAYKEWFGFKPRGMWPAEGSVSQDVAPIFADNGVQWIATGDGVLSRSTPGAENPWSPWRVEGPEGQEIAVVFRDTHLSDLIGFRYQQYEPEEAAEDMVRQLLAQTPVEKDSARFLAVILDGENAWEWYTNDMDAKKTLHMMYDKIAELQAEGKIITVTPSEYFDGNPKRNVPAHPIKSLPKLEYLWPGSWIHGNFGTWIGEEEENLAWIWLQRVFNDLNDYTNSAPKLNKERKAALDAAWDAMRAAEGSDWFWWYGNDQNAPGGDTLWDMLYRLHLNQVYLNLQRAGWKGEVPEIPSLLVQPVGSGDDHGATAKGE